MKIMTLKAQKGAGRPFGWHSGTVTCKDANILGDLTIQDDIIFGGISAGKLAVTGGIDLQNTTSAIGIDLGGTYSTAAINIDGTGIDGRAIRIGSKNLAGTSTDGSLQIASGLAVDAEPANNYLFGLFSKVSASEATSTDELRSAWIRTRIDDDITIGTATGWGYGVCGAEIQLKSYGATINSWQASALWAQLESQGTTTTFASGCIASCVLANVGLTATTTIADGAVAAGVTINSNTAASGVTATGGFYGLYITQKTAGLLDFTDGIHIDAASCTTGINIAGATMGINVSGAVTRAIRVGGANDWGVGSTGLTITATDPLVQVLGKITASNVTAGVYTPAYKQLALVCTTQNTDTSWFADWNELYITGGTLTGSSHYAAVKGHVEVAGTVVSSTGVTASLWGSNIIPAGYTNNGVIAGCYVDGIIHTSMTNTSGRTSAFEIGAHTDPNQGDWNYGFYIPASTCTTGIYMEPAGMTYAMRIGHPSTSVTHGLRIGTAYDALGAPFGIYFDDGGVAITSWGEGFTVGMLYKTASSGGAQTGMPYTAFFYNDVQAAFDGAASCGWSTVMTSFCVTGALSGFEVGVTSLHTSVDVNATSTLASETTLSCISFGGNWISGLSGKIVPLNVRSTNQDWSAFAVFPNADNGCFQLAAASGGTDQFLKIYIGSVLCTIAVKVGT